MRTIWKFAFMQDITPLTMRMPVGARIVHADHQQGVLTLWAEVDTEARKTERDFEVVGTGHPLPDGGTHVHTWQSGPFVWHLYEVTAR